MLSTHGRKNKTLKKESLIFTTMQDGKIQVAKGSEITGLFKDSVNMGTTVIWVLKERKKEVAVA